MRSVLTATVLVWLSDLTTITVVSFLVDRRVEVGLCAVFVEVRFTVTVLETILNVYTSTEQNPFVVYSVACA
jgi:hypothetical protein